MERVCMNFSTGCNMNCDFCYNYFDGMPFDTALCLKVIDRCIDMGVKIFSIGGGDPFNHEEIWTILDYLKHKDLMIQIDTNGLTLDKEKLSRLDHLIDLISLPLDGSSHAMHSMLRKHAMHYDKITELLEYISAHDFNYKLKVNTVATKLNLKDIPHIGRLLLNYKIDIWSIYEFWSLDKAKLVRQQYDLEEKTTDKISKQLRHLQHQTNMYIEINRSQHRYQTYFFTTPQGLVYINDNDNPNEYKILGDIFDDRTIDKFNLYNINTIRTGLDKRFNTEFVLNKI